MSHLHVEAVKGQLKPVVTADDLRPHTTCSVETSGLFLGISRGAAYRAAKENEIPTLRIGGRVLVPVPKLLELVGLPHTDSEAAPASAATAQIRALPKSSGGDHYDTDPAA